MLIECDLHDVYGIDLGDPDVLVTRSWPWLRTRIVGLLSADARVARVFFLPSRPPM